MTFHKWSFPNDYLHLNFQYNFAEFLDFAAINISLYYVHIMIYHFRSRKIFKTRK